MAVGQTIARHTSRLRLVRENLVVDAEDLTWQRQLRALENQIIGRLRLLLPDLRIESIEFRVAVPRRLPQQAAAISDAITTGMPATPFPAPRSPAAAVPDEADQIPDPVLKKVYQLSRRKATA